MHLSSGKRSGAGLELRSQRRILIMIASDVIGISIAALGGTAVGLERQWSGHADGPRARFAGIRTFTMLGAIGGLCGYLWMHELAVAAASVFGGAVAITAAAYVAASRR